MRFISLKRMVDAETLRDMAFGSRGPAWAVNGCLEAHTCSQWPQQAGIDHGGTVQTAAGSRICTYLAGFVSFGRGKHKGRGVVYLPDPVTLNYSACVLVI
jgi:hypothetical protein